MSCWANLVPGMKGLSIKREMEEKKKRGKKEKEGEVEGVELRRGED